MSFILENTELIVSVISLFFGILGVGLAIYYARKSKHTKRLYYNMKTRYVVRNNDNFHGLTLSYNGEIISNYSVTDMWIWNKGNDIINSNDISENDKLRIELSNGKILNIKNVFSVNENNMLDVNNICDNQQCADIMFDYIGKKREGAVFEIIHTADNSTNIELKGEIKGYGAPIIGAYRVRRILDAFGIISSFFSFIKIPNLVKYFFINMIKIVGLLFSLLVILLGMSTFFIGKVDNITGILYIAIGILYSLLISMTFIRKWPSSFDKYFRE